MQNFSEQERRNMNQLKQKSTQNTQALSGMKESDKMYNDYFGWISQMETPKLQCYKHQVNVTPIHTKLLSNQNSLNPKCEDNGIENRQGISERAADLLRSMLCWLPFSTL